MNATMETSRVGPGPDTEAPAPPGGTGGSEGDGQGPRPRRGWIGVDLDGTLARFEEGQPRDPSFIGEPIPRMVARVKEWLAAGEEVRIVTARADGGLAAIAAGDMAGEMYRDVELCAGFVTAWCLEHLGVALKVTAAKDYAMRQLWDDRAVQVLPNTGISLSEVYIPTVLRLRGMEHRLAALQAQAAPAPAPSSATAPAAEVDGAHLIKPNPDDHIAGHLEIGCNERGEVVINLGEDKTGHIVFSPTQARQLAHLLNSKAAQGERVRA